MTMKYSGVKHFIGNKNFECTSPYMYDSSSSGSMDEKNNRISAPNHANRLPDASTSFPVETAEDIQNWVETHFSSLYGFAYRLTGSDCDAEDLVQETFLVALRKGGQIRQSETSEVVRSWLFTILRRLFWRRHRHKRNRKDAGNTENSSESSGLSSTRSASEDMPDREIREILTSDFAGGLDEAWDFVDPRTEPTHQEEQTIDSEQLQQALNALPPEFRMVTLMFSMEQRSYREIAETLQVPIGTVMSRIARARKMLRHTLEKMLDAEESSSPSSSPNEVGG